MKTKKMFSWFLGINSQIKEENRKKTHYCAGVTRRWLASEHNLLILLLQSNTVERKCFIEFEWKSITKHKCQKQWKNYNKNADIKHCSTEQSTTSHCVGWTWWKLQYCFIFGLVNTENGRSHFLCILSAFGVQGRIVKYGTLFWSLCLDNMWNPPDLTNTFVSIKYKPFLCTAKRNIQHCLCDLNSEMHVKTILFIY